MIGYEQIYMPNFVLYSHIYNYWNNNEVELEHKPGM